MFLFENNVLSIRDIHLFNENYESRYYDNYLDDNESVFDALRNQDASEIRFIEYEL